MKRGWTYGSNEETRLKAGTTSRAGRKPLYKGENRLTESERVFAEQNHNAIYDYLHKAGLDIDEYYDIAAFGYIKAVMAYQRRMELRKYAFTTIAWKKIANEIGNEWRKDKRRKGVLDTVSIDREMQDGKENFLRMLGTQDDQYAVVELLIDLHNHSGCTDATKIC